MLKRAGLLFALSISLAISTGSAYASRAASTNVTVSQNGDKTITSKAKANEEIAFTYTKDGILVRKTKGRLGITYTYTADKTLAYAVTDRGSIYTVTRDLKGRIRIISGVRSVKLEATYVGDSVKPQLVTVSKGNGKTFKPLVASAETKTAAYSGQLADKQLAGIYEAYALASADCELDPEADVDGCDGGGDGSCLDDGSCGDPSCDSLQSTPPSTLSLALAAKSAQQGVTPSAFAQVVSNPGNCPNPNPPPPPQRTSCDILYDYLISVCKRIYPGADTGTGDRTGRALCYADAAEQQATCIQLGQ